MELPKNAKDLTGLRFGRLTVSHPLRSEPGKGVIWLCKCDCGGTKEVPASRLQQDKVHSCGCIKRELQAKQNITGQRFGRLVAVELQYYNEKKEDCWLFRCDCGKEKVIPAANVKWSGVRSCGCLHAEHIEQLRKQDIAGQRFGRLKAIAPTEDHDACGSIIWKCICDCGKEVAYSVNRLTRGKTLSCGCLYRESRSTASENRRDAVDGTLLSTLVTSLEPRSDNSSGCTGVWHDKQKDKWHAYINFQKKRYNLGIFRTREQAVKARKAAEERFYAPMIQEKWDMLTEHTKEKFLASAKL